MTWVLIPLAVVPPLILMLLIYKTDRHEREPKGLLFKCALFGAISVIWSLVMELLALYIIGSTMVHASKFMVTAVTAFLGIAVVEETGKFFALRFASWKDPHFNYTFDGIVYSVFASLGFALVENIVYVCRQGLETGLFRVVTAIPGHASFGVYMGYFYGLAKFYEVAGNKSKKNSSLFIGWLVATLLHGFYDFCALSGSQASTIIFFVFIVAMDIAVIVQIRGASKNDTPIYQRYQQPMYRVPFYQAYQTSYVQNGWQGAGGYQPPAYLQQQYGGYANPYPGQPQQPYGARPMQGTQQAYGIRPQQPYMGGAQPQNPNGMRPQQQPYRGGAQPQQPYGRQPQQPYMGGAQPQQPYMGGAQSQNPYVAQPKNPYAARPDEFAGSGIDEPLYGTPDPEGQTSELRNE